MHLEFDAPLIFTPWVPHSEQIVNPFGIDVFGLKILSRQP